MSASSSASTPASAEPVHKALASQVKSSSAPEAAALLEQHPSALIAAVLGELSPAFTLDILAALPRGLVDGVINAVPAETARQWSRNQAFEDGSIGRMMEPALSVFPPEMTVAQTVTELRTLVKASFITYGYVIDPAGKLLGVITMRDLLFAEDDTRLDALMLRDVFALTPELPLADAMRLVLDRHYPVYPVCDAQGVLLGLVRGQAMFQEQAFYITAKAVSRLSCNHGWRNLKLCDQRVARRSSFSTPTMVPACAVMSNACS